MEFELTQKEKEMALNGIVFSTSKPNLLFIQDGLDGGNYTCQASWEPADYITLVINDMNLESDTQLISLSGEEVKALKFGYYYSDSCKDRCMDISESFILNNKGLNSLNESNDKLFHQIENASRTWPFQAANIIAKKLFIEILTFYLRDKAQNRGNDTEISNIGFADENIALPNPIDN